MPDIGDVRYLVLADRAVPYLLARVRWPDVAQAMSAANPDWLEDPGLFDLPYDPSAVTLSLPQAVAVAAGWGARLQTDATENVPSYIRRMPANWSDLSPSERHAWGIESAGRRRPTARRVRLRRPRAATAGHGHAADVASAAASNGHGRLAPAPSAAQTVTDERRGDLRVALDGWAHIRSDDTTFSARLVDLSARGARCVLPEAPPRLARGATLGGPFLLEAGADTTRICLDVGGRISWRRSAVDGTHLGVAFGDLADGDTDGLALLLAATRRKRAYR